MMVYNYRYLGLTSLLLLLVFLVSSVNAQIAEQDETGNVNIQGREKATPTVTFEAQEEASLTPTFEKAWIYSFSEDSTISEVVEIQGTKSFIIVYKEPDENDVGIEEDIIAATDDAVKSAVIDNGGTVTQEFSAVLNGVAADLTTEAIEALMVQDGIAYIEEDIPVYISQQNPTWGQDRVDQPGARDGTYKWKGNKSAGQGINVAIIDTGILSSYLQPGVDPQNKHMNLVGGYNVLSTDPDDWNDCHSHGTHVAGTVGSIDYGVAPGATIWAVKVLSCTGGGTSSGVVSGINWVVQQAKDKGGKWVMNMSLGGGFSQTQNDAVEKARDAGIIVVVAAGNNGSTSNPFACNYSPASAKSAITVGSTDIDDKRSSFSNYGECTDIFAPGRDVLSLSLSGSPSNPVASTKSGTSMASPHVAGAAALYYQNFNTATDAENALFSDAVSGKLYDVTSGSPNLLVQVPLALQGLTGFATPIPTRAPTQGPTAIPTRAPTQSPTQGPTRVPSNAPTQVPTRAPVPPTRAPTQAPTRVPTRAPTPAPVPPTRAPTPAPTRVPTRAPTRAPVPPTRAPTRAPTRVPTRAPTQAPVPPTRAPTRVPTRAPTPPPTTTIPCTNGETEFQFIFVTDDYSWEDNSYKLEKQGQSTALFQQPIGFAAKSRNVRYTERSCLGPGTYTLNVADKYSDGLCCRYGIGSYEVRFNGVKQTLYSSQTSTDTNIQIGFGESIAHVFTISSAVAETPAITNCPSGSSGTPVKLILKSDSFSSIDNHYIIRSKNTGAIVLSRSKGGYNSPAGTLFEDKTCLPSGNYRLMFYDDPYTLGLSDGLCCGGGQGYFQFFIGDVLQTGVSQSWAGAPSPLPSTPFDAVTYDFTII